jgi:hypothetical protein
MIVKIMYVASTRKKILIQFCSGEKNGSDGQISSQKIQSFLKPKQVHELPGEPLVLFSIFLS